MNTHYSTPRCGGVKLRPGHIGVNVRGDCMKGVRYEATNSRVFVIQLQDQRGDGWTGIWSVVNQRTERTQANTKLRISKFVRHRGEGSRRLEDEFSQNIHGGHFDFQIGIIQAENDRGNSRDRICASSFKCGYGVAAKANGGIRVGDDAKQGGQGHGSHAREGVHCMARADVVCASNVYQFRYCRAGSRAEQRKDVNRQVTTAQDIFLRPKIPGGFLLNPTQSIRQSVGSNLANGCFSFLRVLRYLSRSDHG